MVFSSNRFRLKTNFRRNPSVIDTIITPHVEAVKTIGRMSIFP
jgi:hypothetical protein